MEDALFSPKSMAVMFGSGKVEAKGTATITKTIVVQKELTEWNGHTVANVRYHDATGATVTAPAGNEKVFATFEIEGKDTREIVIGPATFPGTYKCVGDTYARAEYDGSDEMFQLTIPKAKVLSENTITMEAEGDPSVFNMDLSVLRSKNAATNEYEMMILTQYSL